MKKSVAFGISLCAVVAFTSCKSSESAYKKAYEQAKQQELGETTETTPVEVAPAVSTPVETVKVTVPAEEGVRQEKVTVVSGNDGLKEYSVVCGSFTLKANAENLRNYLITEGYHPTVAYNAESGMYRVIVSSYSDRTSAADARDSFKAKYPNRKDFKDSWLLYKL